MKRIWVTEHERVYKGAQGTKSERIGGRVVLSRRHFERLQRFDERAADTEGRQIFEWRSRYARATQWVGVLQVGELSIEVLPKIERGISDGAYGREAFARKNLLYMLSLTGELPLRDRDIASQAAYEAPILETLIRIFAERLLKELLRGLDSEYVDRERNIGTVRGKLLFSEDIRHNVGRRDRLFCKFDEFLADTVMNRAFRACCRRLLLTSSGTSTREKLSRCIAVLDDVADVEISPEALERVVLHRQNERFQELFNFCKLILSNQSPAGTSGSTSAFSLFFDMNVLFESYVAAMLSRYVAPIRSSPTRVYPQSRGNLRHLVFSPRGEVTDGYDPERDGHKSYPLKADILVHDETGWTVLDTKWKRLSTKKARQGVGPADLLQLYAYATRYEASSNILLYPAVPDATPQDFHLPLGPNGLQSIQVRFIDMNRDLLVERKLIAKELAALLASGSGDEHSSLPMSP